MAIYTARYQNPELKKGLYLPVRISMGTPAWKLGYTIAGEIRDLMPFGLKGKGYEDFRREYASKLDKIGMGKIKLQLSRFQDGCNNVVLLCYEDVRKQGTWCHRTMFAEWWKERTGEPVEELSEKPASPINRFVQMTIF